MHKFLAQLLNKRGIETIDDLAPEEKITYQNWNKVLSREKELTVEHIKEFLTFQKDLIEKRYVNPDHQHKDDTYWKACLHVYLTLLEALAAPQVERENLEKHLNQLINS